MGKNCKHEQVLNSQLTNFMNPVLQQLLLILLLLHALVCNKITARSLLTIIPHLVLTIIEASLKIYMLKKLFQQYIKKYSQT